ncbi:MAG: fumarylacetoacetate hydrolase family protein [Deltaproteobacteria bacterium]|nr:fumarylacetoacetate hydrolase family protein [Deltaproteobacteria bacterium]
MADTKAVAGRVRPHNFILVFLAAGMPGMGCSFSWSPSFDEDVTPSELQTVAITSPHDALTFARYEEKGDTRLMLVTAYAGNMISGVPVHAHLGGSVNDPISLYRQYGYASIEAIAQTGEPLVRIPLNRLILPVNLRRHNIAAGTNYAAHANEAGVEDGPYLFPKIVAPTPWNADVNVNTRLLDYEVELAFVTLDAVEAGAMPESMGLIICNDYTDRETLLKNIDVDNVASGDGFTTGKSFPGYLPVGNLFVIPRDFRSFAAEIELRLYVNFELRQKEHVSSAIWDIDEIFRQIWIRQDTTWEHRGETVSLFGNDNAIIEDRVMILSGTPYGVVFNEVTGEQKATGFFDWAFSDWGGSISDHSIEDYITDARAAGIYLLTGDLVDIHVNHMGAVRNKVVE